MSTLSPADLADILREFQSLVRVVLNEHRREIAQRDADITVSIPRSGCAE